MGQDLLHRNARMATDMLEQGNTDRHQEGSGERPLIALDDPLRVSNDL